MFNSPNDSSQLSVLTHHLTPVAQDFAMEPCGSAVGNAMGNARARALTETRLGGMGYTKKQSKVLKFALYCLL